MTAANRSTAYVSVGSNIDPAANVRAALALLLRSARVTAVSSLYRSAPLGRPEQPPFVNGVWQVSTSLEARRLKFDVLRAIEDQLGRIRTADAYAPRTIDLDIAVYDDAVIHEPDLTVPDPEILRRPFLAVPLVELAPELVFPGTDLRIADQPVCGRRAELEPLVDLTIQLREMIEP